MKFFVAMFIITLAITFRINAQTNTFPSTIPGLKLWLKSDSGITLSGGDVSGWADQSGNGNNATQINANSQPKYVQNNINNLPTLRFGKNGQTGNQTFLTFPQLNFSTNNFTILMVYKPFGRCAAVQYILGSNNIGISTCGTFSTNALLFDGTNVFQENSSPLSYGFLTFYGDRIFRNGIQSAASGTPVNAMSFNCIGTRPDYPSLYFWGELAEVIIYDNALSITNRNQVEQYLHTKYAPPVNLGLDKTLCSLPFTLKAKKDYFTNYSWMGGTSLADSLVINSAGTYYITTTDLFGYQSTDSITLKTDIVPPFNLGNDTTLCYNGTNPLNLHANISGGPYNYLWTNSFATNLSINNTISINVSDLYTLKVSSTTCSYSDSIAVTMDNLANTANLNLNTISSCLGTPIYLISGIPQADINNYVWSLPGGGSSVNDTVFVSGPGTYSLTVKDVNGCTASDNLTITNILGQAPTANFLSTNACIGDSTHFTDASIANGGSIINRTWNFGDNTANSNLLNPAHLFNNTGSDTVRLTVTNTAGCINSVAKIITTIPDPIVHYTAIGICGNSVTTFTDKTNTLGYPITNWSWNFGDGSASVNVQNPVHPFATNGSYHVILTVNNANGCSGTLDSLITIYNVIADFNYTTACKNDSIQFTDNSVFPASTYGVKSFWNFGGTGTYSATSVSSSIPPRNPKWLFGSNVVYNVTHIVTSSIGCIDTIVKAVSVHPKPKAFFSFGTACIGAPTNLFDLSVISGDSITKWDWSFATLPNDTIKNPIHVFNILGNNSINLMVTSSNGCKDNISNTIVVNPSPVANFTFTPNVGSPPLTVTFVNTSSGALYSNWDFGDNSYSSSTNPTHTYMDTLVYQIKLTETNSFGCTKTKTDSIHVSKPILDIAVENVTAILKNNYLNVIAKLHNLGTVNIDSLDLYVSINNGPRIKENWTKGLAASGIDQQTLTTSIYLTDSKHFVCVTALKPNGVDDINANNNEACEAVDVSTFDALDPYPNPANDFLTLPLIIPSKNNLQLVLYDARGEISRTVFSGIIPEGLQMLTVNTNELNAGLYVFKIEYNNQLLMKKFIKR